MRFLVDNALSPLVARQLIAAGHDAVRLRDRRIQSASDVEVVELAAKEDRVVVSADTDFGTILALREATRPSFILIRGDAERRPARQAEVLLEYIPQLEQVLLAGAIVVISATRIRVRHRQARWEGASIAQRGKPVTGYLPSTKRVMALAADRFVIHTDMVASDWVRGGRPRWTKGPHLRELMKRLRV